VIPPTVGSSLLMSSHLLLRFSIPLTMPPRKQPPQQDLEEEDDNLVNSKQFKEMMDMMESLTASMNETFNKTTTSMNEMLHKSQASTKTTLEKMQCGIVTMADRVQALLSRLPIAPKCYVS
jgi:ATP-dependent Zn protease